ncbi:alpha/beta fold hydrolase [Polaribacter sp. WD7]|uniref:alpha/beta fold hydrolase n=1 Tax=Polaribacter sp. WD7 TaxID=2269061 RepID=UPI000DF3BD66|nr:alpha/beta fold hydrolase [Polaribacter sp. WD7]RCS26822.1 alpha/beta fold hydrolase [Polaribacter sp. WD7]
MLNKLVYFFLIVCLFALISCASKKEITNATSQTYTDFRAQQKSFLSSDGNIKYIDKGQGEAILLLHGVPSSSWLYRKMIDGLVTEGYRVIAPDMLGFGNSDNPKGYDIYSEKNHAKRIIELMNNLKIDTWTHVTHDAGGLWTWALLENNPKRIDNLILLNTIIYEEGFNPPIRMKKGVFSKFAMWMYKNGVTTNMLLNGLFKKGLKKNDLTKTEIEGYKKPLREGKTRAMYYFFSKTCNELPVNDNVVNSFNKPTAIIWGKHDNMLKFAPQQTKLIKTMNIEKENVHILDAKHFIQEEKPEEINKLILRFLKNL